MSFGVGALPGGRSTPAGGQVDYRIVRQHVLAEFGRGRLARREICDAHPELLRVATNLGRPTPDTCPVCREANLVLVSWAFGSRLPASGRCVNTLAEMTALSRRRDESRCYVVEVCTQCRWNHLRRSFGLGRPVTARTGSGRTGSERTGSGPTGAGRTGSGLAESQETGSQGTGPARTVAGRTVARRNREGGALDRGQST
ncbi:MAG: DUF5318 family protein [Acidimicrobiales bacterium]